MAAIPLTFRRIRLLLWKNLLMRRRHWIITSLEIILPTLLSILLVYIRTSVDFGEAYVQFPPDENGETGFPLISESVSWPLLFAAVDNFTVLDSAIF